MVINYLRVASASTSNNFPRTLVSENALSDLLPLYWLHVSQEDIGTVGAGLRVDEIHTMISKCAELSQHSEQAQYGFTKPL